MGADQLQGILVPALRGKARKLTKRNGPRSQALLGNELHEALLREPSHTAWSQAPLRGVSSQAELGNKFGQFAICNFCCIFLTSILLLSSSGCHRKSAPEIVYIGHVASFRGPDKLSGDHARQGILLALEE